MSLYMVADKANKVIKPSQTFIKIQKRVMDFISSLCTPVLPNSYTSVRIRSENNLILRLIE